MMKFDRFLYKPDPDMGDAWSFIDQLCACQRFLGTDIGRSITFIPLNLHKPAVPLFMNAQFFYYCGSSCNNCCALLSNTYDAESVCFTHSEHIARVRYGLSCMRL